MPIRYLKSLFSGRDAGAEVIAPLGRPARVPDGLRVYAVGDVHGRFDLLTETERLIKADLAGRPSERALLIYLGDFIDRGPDSRKVVEHLRTAQADGLPRRYLRGNHEETMIQFLADPEVADAWRRYGGLETLHSYGVDVRDLMRGAGAEEAQVGLRIAIPPSHLEFLQKLETLLVIGDYCFVHAGLKPGVPLERQTPESMLWIREEFLGYPGSFGKVVVHGHTPVDEPTRTANRINVDTGAYLTGRLTTVVLEGDTVGFFSTGR